MTSAIQIDADFPGGNILVDKIEGDKIWLRQDLRDTEGWWFHFLFRIAGVAGQEITFHFTNGNPFALTGPSIRADGVNWEWAGAEVTPEGDGSENVRTTVCFPPATNTSYVTYSIPYTESNLKTFLAGHAADPNLRVSELTTSEQGRAVEKLVLRRPGREPSAKILLTARHHACESVADYVLEGVLDFALDPASGLLDRAEILVIPFIDKDGVEQGDQGKNRRPHDHNRDYTDEPIYATTRALMRELDSWADERLVIALDLHCPWIRSGRNNEIFFCEPPESHSPGFQRLVDLLAKTQTGKLRYDPANNIGHGVDWNTGDRPTCGGYVRSQTAAPVVTTLEFPYGVAGGAPVTADRARDFGRSLARAMQAWIAPEEP